MQFRRHPAGISVIEVMIALGIAVIIVISVGSLIISTHSLDTEASRQLQAVGFAKQWLEVVDVQRNTFFGCTCNPTSPCPGNTCTTVGGNAQTCTPRAGFNSCWVARTIETPTSSTVCANDATHAYKLAASGTSWNVVCANPIAAISDTDYHPDYSPGAGFAFTRTMKIENMQRDSNGAIVTSGTEDPNTKKVTVTVQWMRASATRQVQLSEIVTAWKNF